MKRKEFIEKLGLGAAFVLTSACLGGCTKDDDDNPSTGGGTTTGVDFTIDLTADTNANLNENGGYIIRNGIVIAKNLDGNYVAATQTCSHERKTEIIFQENEWRCTAHGARFDQSGTGLNDNGSKGLTIYKTELSGNNLRIYS